jgi:hypothetical protein
MNILLWLIFPAEEIEDIKAERIVHLTKHEDSSGDRPGGMNAES